MSLRRHVLKHKVGFSAVCATLILAVALAWAWQPELDARTLAAPAFMVASSGLTLLLFLGLLRAEARRPRAVARRPGSSQKEARSKHIEALGDFMRLMNRNSLNAYQAQVYARVRAYVNDQSGPLHEPLDAGPDHGGATSASREPVPGMGHLFVVVPRAGDPYWIRCNRAIEAMKYCRRVHPTGFDVAVWARPLPERVKLVDLIG